MKKVEVVTFDIANQSFDYYTMEQWNRQIEIWREEMLEDGFSEEVLESADYEEVVELMYGGELFFDIVD